MKSNRFYLACLRDNVGSNLSFHCKDGKGYSTDISKAEMYTLEEAQKRWNGAREFDLPLCADKIDALAVFHVDCQYIPSESNVVEGCTQYVAYQKRNWDGNDVYWKRLDGCPTTDFSKAAIFDAPVVDENYVSLPFELVDAVKRPTVSARKIDRRRMIQAAGLITPDHIKRHRRRRESSGKSRWNCPGCGKLSWQYNPHDFDGCKDYDCSEWRPSPVLDY